MASNYSPKLSTLVTFTGGGFQTEDWQGGDFFIKKGDKLTVKQNISIMVNKKDLKTINKGDILSIEEVKNGFVIFKWKSLKYKVLLKEFLSVSSKLD